MAGFSLDTKNDGSFYLRDGHLYLGGVRTKILGANSYGILSSYLGIGSVTKAVPDSLQRIRDASKSGLMAIRFWVDVAPSDY